MNELAVTCLLVLLIELVEHYFPWRLVLARDLPRLAAYVLGTAGIILPLTWLFVVREQWFALLALWAAVISAGLAVGLAYLVDHILQRLALARELQEIIELREEK